MEVLTDVWTLETADQELANDDLQMIIDEALKLQGTSARTYLRKLWDGEEWDSIERKLITESSAWYVWYMAGVNQHLYNIREE